MSPLTGISFEMEDLFDSITISLLLCAAKTLPFATAIVVLFALAEPSIKVRTLDDGLKRYTPLLSRM